MPGIYTHKFKFELDSGWLEGEAEFNTDNRASFKMGEWSQPLPERVLTYFTEMTDLLVRMTHDDCAIKHISFKLKE